MKRIALALSLTIALVETAHVWSNPLGSWVGVNWDPAATIWWLTWFPHAIGLGVGPLFTDYINYPVGVNAFWGGPSSSLLALIGTPITLVWNGILTYNVLLFAGLALTGWTTFLAASRIITSRWPAVLAGALMEISPSISGHAGGDLVLIFLPTFPLMFIVFYEAFYRRSMRPWVAGLCFSGLVAAQMLIGDELVAVIFVTCVVAACVGLALSSQPRLALIRREVPTIGWALICTTVVVGPLFWFIFFGPGAVHGAIVRKEHFGSDLANFMVPSAVQLFSPDMRVFDPFESALYFGPAMLVAIMYALKAVNRRRDVTAVAVTALVIGILSLGPSLKMFHNVTAIPLPWAVVANIPVVGNLQPQRLTLAMDLLLVIVIAWVVDEGSKRRWSKPLAIAAIVAWLPVFPLPTASVSVPLYFSDAARRLPQGEVAILLPFSYDFSTTDPMIWQTRAGMQFKMPEGYFFSADSHGNSTFGPPSSLLTGSLIGLTQHGVSLPSDVKSQAEMRSEIASLSVRYVIAGPMSRLDLVNSELSNLLGCKPTETEGVLLWADLRNGSCA